MFSGPAVALNLCFADSQPHNTGTLYVPKNYKLIACPLLEVYGKDDVCSFAVCAPSGARVSEP